MKIKKITKKIIKNKNNIFFYYLFKGYELKKIYF